MPLGNDKEAKVALEAQKHGEKIIQAAREKKEKEKQDLIKKGLVENLYDNLGKKVAKYRYIAKYFGILETDSFFENDESFKKFFDRGDLIWFQRMDETEFTMPNISDLNI